MSDTKRIEGSIKLYPMFFAFSADLIFFVPIDTLFLTLVKGLNASQISAMTMLGLLVCVVAKKIVVKITKNIGNTNSVRLGAFMILLSVIILTFGKSFSSMVLYRVINGLAYMFCGMLSILLRNDLISINRGKEFFSVRNKAKILYGIMTMITALISGYLFNVDKYLPMYISIAMHFILFLLSFKFCEAEVKDNAEETEKENKKVKITSIIFLLILSNAVFFSIINLGQNNSKLFMQYDFQKVLSVEKVTYYIAVIVFLSRIARIIGNAVFGKLYLKIKDKMSIVLAALETMAFLLLIIGHTVTLNFTLKVIVMSLGFFLILAIRDSFQIYVEDIALKITNKEEQQKTILNIQVCSQIGQLLLSGAFTLILMKYELIVLEFILLVLAMAEVVISKKLCDSLEFNYSETTEKKTHKLTQE